MLLRVFSAMDRLRYDGSARFRPVRTHRYPGNRKFPPDQMEVSQGEQGEEMAVFLEDSGISPCGSPTGA